MTAEELGITQKAEREAKRAQDAAEMAKHINGLARRHHEAAAICISIAQDSAKEQYQREGAYKSARFYRAEIRGNVKEVSALAAAAQDAANKALDLAAERPQDERTKAAAQSAIRATIATLRQLSIALVTQQSAHSGIPADIPADIPAAL